MVCVVCRADLTAPDNLFCPQCSESQEQRARVCSGNAAVGHERTVLLDTWKGCPVCLAVFEAQPSMKNQCPGCSYQYDGDFDWCPRCGTGLSQGDHGPIQERITPGGGPSSDDDGYDNADGWSAGPESDDESYRQAESQKSTPSSALTC